MVRRRTVLHILSSLIAWGTVSRKIAAQPALDDEHTARVRALGGAVLPREIGADGCTRAVDQFMNWLRDYRPGAEADHEYGGSKLSRLPPSPADHYASQLDDLDRRSGGSFDSASLADQQLAVTEAVVAAGVKDLPARPDGGHIATDLMTHYFNSADANDLAYGRAIGRFACRGLPESDKRPAVLARAGDAQ